LVAGTQGSFADLHGFLKCTLVAGLFARPQVSARKNKKFKNHEDRYHPIGVCDELPPQMC